MAEQSFVDFVNKLIYQPGPQDPIPQADRNKFQTQRVDLMQKYLPQLAAERERAKGLRAKDPLLDLVLKITEASFGSPSDVATGGSRAGVIAPTGNKFLQGLIEAVRGKAPGLVQKAEGVSETVFPYLVPRELMPVTGDVVGALRRSKTLPKSELYIRGGRPQPEQVDTMAHELRHFVTGSDPRIAEMVTKRPGQAVETAQQLSHMMPPAQQAGMQHYLTGVGERGLAGTPMEVMQKLGGGIRKVTPKTAKDPAVAFDEAMSYLTESLLNPQGGDPALTAIAEALGQGLK